MISFTGYINNAVIRVPIQPSPAKNLLRFFPISIKMIHGKPYKYSLDDILTRLTLFFIGEAFINISDTVQIPYKKQKIDQTYNSFIYFENY